MNARKTLFFAAIAAPFCAAHAQFSIGSIAEEATRIQGERMRALQQTVERESRAARILWPSLTNVQPGPTELRSSDIPPVALSKTVSRLSSDEQQRLIDTIFNELKLLDAELAERVAIEPKTPELEKEISELNESISAKRQALDLARAEPGSPMTNAAAESFAAVANPYFLICGDTLWAKSDPLRWGDQIAKHRDRVLAIGRSVGMIELKKSLIGTGFVVGKSHVITNLHVARDIADYDVKTKSWAVRDGATITFDAEFELGPSLNCATPRPKRTYFVNAVYSTPKNMQDDIAILLTASDAHFPPPVEVSMRPNASYKSNMLLAVLGYPGPPRDMTVAERMEYFSGPQTRTAQFVYKRISAGDTGDELVTSDGKFVHKVNTAGGNSGSPILDLADGSVVGIHVEGRDRNNAVLGYNRGLTGERVRALLSKAGLIK